MGSQGSYGYFISENGGPFEMGTLKNQPHILYTLYIVGRYLLGTLPETNIAPRNGWLEYYFPIGQAYFQGLC